MTITKLSKVFYIIGFTVLFISILQWFFLYPDLSQLMFGVLMGINLCGWGYLHSWMRAKDGEISKIKNQCDSIAKWYHEKDWGIKKKR